MNARADRFNLAIGKQIRAEIAAAGLSISSVARDLGIARSALDNYVTGKRAIPVPIAYQVGEIVGVDPQVIVQRAQERFTLEEAHRDSNVVEGRFGVGASVEDEPSVKQPPAKQRTAARKGVRKADAAPHAE